MNMAERDILSNLRLSMAAYCLPIAVMLAAGSLALDAWARGLAWAVCLGVMAGACLANARRCGRVHCYFAGPFLLLMALLSLAHGFGFVPLGRQGWNWIAAASLLGSFALCVASETVLGRYRRR